MVKVHVWMPDSTHVGHTALTVRDVYISFWPDGEAGKKDLKIKRSQPGMLAQHIHEDIANEGNRPPLTINIDNIDENRILDYIASIQSDVPRYQIARNNCSHIVAMALMKGADSGPSFNPDAGQYGRFAKIFGKGIWTPDQVLRFAKEIKNA
jgi:hypothetical protein